MAVVVIGGGGGGSGSRARIWRQFAAMPWQLAIVPWKLNTGSRPNWPGFMIHPISMAMSSADGTTSSADRETLSAEGNSDTASSL